MPCKYFTYKLVFVLLISKMLDFIMSYNDPACTHWVPTIIICISEFIKNLKNIKYKGYYKSFEI
ncbi:unnamed protein product [Acanthoscelides obtectus]|uniref:Uncharacterized protein n=1 Tax=Acanthoscelides obtectus TaxID=200917 RepID=A0A9P0M6N6_ACAOB|nr:unnamed protein product [Acanthoscelides obtectus]CAK1670309.1 hypothetical protein AOBTE_LOCUS27550 [Acanthoscelides obtectus]